MKAEPLYNRSRTIIEGTLGRKHHSLAITLNNLALLYVSRQVSLGKLDKQQCKEAESLYKQSLEIYEEAFGANHPSSAGTIYNLACLYTNLENYREADFYFRKAVGIYEKAPYGPEHRDLVTVLSAYAIMLHGAGYPSEAAKHEERAKAIRQKHALQNRKN